MLLIYVACGNMSGNTRHSPVRMSKQIYAEAESRTNLFVLPRREQYMWTQSKYTQKPRAMQEAEGKCRQSLHAAEGLLHCRGATVYVAVRLNIRRSREQNKFICFAEA